MNPTVDETKKNNAWYDFSILVGWLLVCHDDSQLELYLDQGSWTLVFLLSSSTDVTHFEGSVAWYPPRTAPKKTVSTTLIILFLCNQLCSPSLVLPFLYWPGLSFFFFCLFLFLYVLPWLALFIFLFPLFALLQLVRTCVKSYRILSSLPPSATRLSLSLCLALAFLVYFPSSLVCFASACLDLC